ncbi:PAS domain S-box protein [candidate division KSB1 bacterium]|nr:PAS domain S-box protein [candidate division KSB1 bacterium]
MKLSLRKKIFLGYGISLALATIVFIWAFINLISLSKASDNILRENYKSILAAENMINAIERQNNAMLLLIFGYQDEGLKQFYENESQFLQWFGKASDNITIKGEAEIIETINKEFSKYQLLFLELTYTIKSDLRNSAKSYHEKVLPALMEVKKYSIQLREINQKTMFQASEKAKNIAGKTMWSMILIGITALGIGLGFSLFFSIIILNPIRYMTNAALKIANGNYEAEILVKSSDELGILAEKFNTMVKKIKMYRDLNIRQIVVEKKKLETILHDIDDGIVVIDETFRIANINGRAAQIVGLEIDNCLNRHFLEIFKSEQLFEQIKHSIESGDAPLIEEGKNVLSIEKKGGISHYEFSITPIQIAKTDRIFNSVLLLRDITRLKELDRMKSEFVMAASHELRTPLTAMSMSINLLSESAKNKLTEKEMELLDAALEETQRLKALVNDLLDLSKIEAGKMDLTFESIAVIGLIERAVSILKTQAEEKGIDITFQIQEDLPLVKADANKITWVLTNLIANSLRFVENGGFIKLKAEKTGSYIQISVQDNGMGIPYEYQSKIFDKFMQVKDKKNIGGTGLGLTICKEIIRAHGGTIWLESVPNEGSTFYFTLVIQ